MTNNKMVATVATVGAVTIALADAPQWTVEPFIGWVAAASGVAILGQFAPPVAKGMAGLMLAALLLSRGPDALKNVGKLIPGTRR
jgi:hypothetical protein